MRKTWTSLAITLALVLAGISAAGAAERYEDAVGDVVGSAPDIVAVTVSEPEGESTIRFDIEFTNEPPLSTGMETWTDVLFLIMSADADVDDRGILSGELYSTGTHGVTLESQLDSGALLNTPETMYWYVVDLDTDGPVLAFTLDRQLLSNPLDLYWQVLVGVEREEEGQGEAEGDLYPDEGEPPAVYRIGGTSF